MIAILNLMFIDMETQVTDAFLFYLDSVPRVVMSKQKKSTTERTKEKIKDIFGSHHDLRMRCKRNFFLYHVSNSFGLHSRSDLHLSECRSVRVNEWTWFEEVKVCNNNKKYDFLFCFLLKTLCCTNLGKYHLKNSYWSRSISIAKWFLCSCLSIISFLLNLLFFCLDNTFWI